MPCITSSVWECVLSVSADRRNIAEEGPDAVCHLRTRCWSINCRKRWGLWPGDHLSWQGRAHPLTCRRPKKQIRVIKDKNKNLAGKTTLSFDEKYLPAAHSVLNEWMSKSLDKYFHVWLLRQLINYGVIQTYSRKTLS